VLINARTESIVAADVEVADTRRARRRGLLGRPGLDSSSALVIVPCFAIHTAFMQFAIDVIFTARDGRVVQVVRGLGPWRLAVAPAAHAAIELVAGAAPADLAVGDLLILSS
jgi:uncharacterized protein